MWSVNDYKADVAKEAEYLVRTMKDVADQDHSSRETNEDKEKEVQGLGLKKKKSGKFRDVFDGVKNSPYLGSSTLVPDAEELWG